MRNKAFIFFLICLNTDLSRASYGVDLDKVLREIEFAPTLELQRIDYKIKTLKLDDALNLSKPTFELNANQNFLESDEYVEPSDITLSITKPIFTWGALESEVLASEIEQKASRLAIQVTRTQLRIQAIEAFLTGTSLSRLGDHLRESLEILTQYRTLIANRVAQYVSPRIDLELVESRIAKNDARQSEILRLLDDARAKIEIISGLHIDHFGPPACFADQAYAKNEVELVKAAVKNSRQIEYLKTIVAAAAERATAVRLNRLPHLNLGVGLQSDRYSSKPEYSGFLSFNYQFQGSEQEIEQYLQQSRIREAEVELERYTRTLTADVKILASRIRTGERKMQALSTLVASKDLELKSFFKQFRVGKRKWESVLVSANELTEAKIDYEETLWSHCMANLILREIVSEAKQDDQ